MVSKKGGLGKGLGALINNDELETSISLGSEKKEKVIEIDINKIEPNKNQPRTDFNEESLSELAKSIESIGIISPIIVAEKGSFYEIIAGERRWRAARLAKIKKIPAIIKTYSELERLEVALIENIQREDLNPVEEALTYQKFHDEFKLNQEAIAEKVGKSRAAVANSLRLLKLDSRVLNFLKEGKLSSGHARAVIPIDENDVQFEIAEKIIEDRLSVRQVEELVKAYNEAKNQPKQEKKEPNRIDEAKKAAYKTLEKNLNRLFGTKVSIKNGKNKGKIEIEYYSEDELDRLVNMFKKL